MKNKAQAALEKEWRALEKQEKKLSEAAAAAKSGFFKTQIEKYVPDKVYSGLETAFCKGFELVFDKGKGLIDKSLDKESILEDHSIRDYALKLKKGRKQWREMHRGVQRSALINMAVTTVEGIGLGALGIGLPDVVLFLSGLIRGIYEIALNYGFDYDTADERYIILKMMAASLSVGDERAAMDAELTETFKNGGTEVTDEMISAQMKETSAVFAMDMLVLKFVQGLPVVGVIGGAANPVYYKKVTDYVKLCYRRRYLLKHSESALFRI